MRSHDLKCVPSQFEAVLSGEKPWEFRENDRDFMVGDELVLREWDPASPRCGSRRKGDEKYTGRAIRARVVYVLHGGRFGIPAGFCIMTLDCVELEGGE